MTDKDYLTTQEIADLLGVQPVTVRAYSTRGQMPPANDCPCCGLGPVWSRYVIEEWLNERGQRGSDRSRDRGDTARP